jgi:hypothetical protein
MIADSLAPAIAERSIRWDVDFFFGVLGVCHGQEGKTKDKRSAQE